MVVTVAPSINQMRFSLIEIKNLFEDLDNKTAIHEAKLKIKDLLVYIETIRSTNDASVVVGNGKGTSMGIKLKGFVRNDQRIY